jgi:glucokinase
VGVDWSVPVTGQILAGDIGGTNARLALFDAAGTSPAVTEVYPSAEHDGLGEIVEAFLATHPAEPLAASFGIAGPVRGGRTTGTNLAWEVDAQELRARLRIERLELLNDLEANAWGLEALDAEDLMPLHDSDPEPGGTVALISAGTGLGEAFLTYGPSGPAVQASEGGHVDFAPRSDLEAELRDWLAGTGEEHVSYERVCSGMGLVNIYAFLRERAGAPEPSWLESAEPGGGAAAISTAGLDRSDALASEALDLMVSIYGAQAGNLALTVLATGGVYLGGGIAPRIVDRLGEGGFLHSFRAKGRMADLIQRIPVHVVLNDRAALLGAARHAVRLAG